VAVVLATFRDYGATWDEFVQSRYGELVLAYFRSGFSDRRCNSFEDLYYYGPLFETLAAAAYEWAGAWKEEIRHLMSALAGTLAVWGTIRYARLFPRAGALPLWAGASLLLWPRFYGHAFVNSKDIPFACAFVWAMYAAARWSLAGGGRRETLGVGLATGLALALRPGGVIVLALVSLAGLPLLLGPRRAAAVGQLAAILGLAWLVMVSAWPWALDSPIAHPLQAMQLSFKFPLSVPMLFDGRWVRADDLPWNYVPKWLAITTPEAFVVLGGIGALVAVARASHTADSLMPRLTLAWVVLPLLYVLLRRPPLYDEIRHLLFLLPGAAVLVGLGLEWLMAGVATRQPRLAWLLPLLLLQPVPDLVRLHPYQMTYFNETTRATSGTLSERYDTDYWLSSYKEAMQWVNRQPVAPGRLRHVLVAGSPAVYYTAAYYAAPHVVAVPISAYASEKELPAGFDTYIGTTRWFLHGLYPEVPVVYVVARDSMAYAVVRSRVDPPLDR
jgi:4-amino-4-deoxy-L-arabinose transferase-like glycosyltransferase